MLGSAGRRLAALSAIRALRHDQHGVSALEFALLAPVLITLLLASVESANLFYLRNEMVAATRDAARRLSVSSLDTAGARALIQERLRGRTDATLDITIEEVELKGSAGTDIVVEVSVAMAEAMITGFGGAGSSYDRKDEEPAETAPSPALKRPLAEKELGAWPLDKKKEEPDVDVSSDDGPLRIRASTTMLKEI